MPNAPIDEGLTVLENFARRLESLDNTVGAITGRRIAQCLYNAIEEAPTPSQPSQPEPVSDRAKKLCLDVFANQGRDCICKKAQATLTAQANEIWEEAAKIAEELYNCTNVAASLRARKEPKT